MYNGNLNFHIFRHNLFRVHHTDLLLCRNNFLSLRQRPIVYRRKFQFFQILYHRHRTAKVSERYLSVLKMLCNKIFSLLYKCKGTIFILLRVGKIQALLVFRLGFACRQKPNVLECAVGFLQ